MDHFPEEYWVSSLDTLSRLNKIALHHYIIEQNSKADAFVAIGIDLEKKSKSAGYGNLAQICRSAANSLSIIEYKKSSASLAGTIAHEIGHNLGMHHDFDTKPYDHVARGCDGKGFLSYGSHPLEWSVCSRDDLLTHYRFVTQGSPNFPAAFRKKWAKPWCLDPEPAACT